MLTPEEADEYLANAIRIHADAYDMSLTGELLADFAIIANWQSKDGTNDSGYTIHYRRNSVPHHVAVGLFSVGLDLVSNQDIDE